MLEEIVINVLNISLGLYLTCADPEGGGGGGGGAGGSNPPPPPEKSQKYRVS